MSALIIWMAVHLSVNKRTAPNPKAAGRIRSTLRRLVRTHPRGSHRPAAGAAKKVLAVGFVYADKIGHRQLHLSRMKTKTAPDAPSAKEVLAQFEKLADPQTKKTLLRHCIPEPVLGVKIGEMKKIQKKLRNHHALALELYESGIYDVMYFAGLIADSKQVTKAELQRWLDRALCGSIAVFTVGALAAESSAGLELAMKWIESPRERVASAGWATLAGIAGHVPDDKLPIAGFRK